MTHLHTSSESVSQDDQIEIDIAHSDGETREYRAEVSRSGQKDVTPVAPTTMIDIHTGWLETGGAYDVLISAEGSYTLFDETIDPDGAWSASGDSSGGGAGSGVGSGSGGSPTTFTTTRQVSSDSTQTVDVSVDRTGSGSGSGSASGPSILIDIFEKETHTTDETLSGPVSYGPVRQTYTSDTEEHGVPGGDVVNTSHVFSDETETANGSGGGTTVTSSGMNMPGQYNLTEGGLDLHNGVAGYSAPGGHTFAALGLEAHDPSTGDAPMPRGGPGSLSAAADGANSGAKNLSSAPTVENEEGPPEASPMVETSDYPFDPSAHVEYCSCACDSGAAGPAGTGFYLSDYYDQQLNGGGASDEEEDHQGDWVGTFTNDGTGVTRNGITVSTLAVTDYDSTHPDATPADWDEFFSNAQRQHVLAAFEFLYGADGLQMLEFYEQAGNSWYFTDLWFSWFGRVSDLDWVDGDQEIQLDEALNPIQAAQELMKQLLEAWGDPAIRERIVAHDLAGDGEKLHELLQLSNQQALAEAAAIAAQLTEAYSAGILEWTPHGTIVLVFAYASDGQLGSATLSAIPLPLALLRKEGHLGDVFEAAMDGTFRSADDAAAIVGKVDGVAGSPSGLPSIGDLCDSAGRFEHSAQELLEELLEHQPGLRRYLERLEYDPEEFIRLQDHGEFVKYRELNEIQPGASAYYYRGWIYLDRSQGANLLRNLAHEAMHAYDFGKGGIFEGLTPDQLTPRQLRIAEMRAVAAERMVDPTYIPFGSWDEYEKYLESIGAHN